MSQAITPVLGEATSRELREGVCGEILTETDEGQIEAVRIWNGADDRRPAVPGFADVIALSFAPATTSGSRHAAGATAAPASRRTTT